MHFGFVAGLLAAGPIAYAMIGIGSTVETVIAILVAFGARWGPYRAVLLRSAAHPTQLVGASADVIMRGGMAEGMYGSISFGTVAERVGYGPA